MIEELLRSQSNGPIYETGEEMFRIDSSWTETTRYDTPATDARVMEMMDLRGVW